MTRHDRIWLACVALVFLAWHVPLMYRTAAGQDEHWFGIPGITIERTGLPQLPYLSSPDPAQICYRTDVLLYVLPPLSFYLQALVHLVLGDGLGQARLASALEALGAAWVVYRLGLHWFPGDRRGVRLGVVMYLFSRVVLFPATTARPDMAAAFFGLLAVWGLVCYQAGQRQSRSALLGSGVAAGLSMLAHPFGAVPSAQVGLALLREPGSLRRRVTNAALFSILALLVLALWLPLIALHPDLFRIQFGGNVLNRAVPGLGSTMLGPPGVLVYQAAMVARHVMPIQSALYLAGYAWALTLWRGTGQERAFLYHLTVSLLLMMLFTGRHPGVNYYAFSAAFASLAVGMLASRVAAALERYAPALARWRGGREAVSLVIAAALVAALVPGSGLTTLMVHLRHWNDPAYDVKALVRRIAADLPPTSLAAVETAYILEFYLAGRPVVSATVYPKFYDARRHPFEYAVFDRPGLKLDRPQMDDLIFLKSYGNHGDPFAPYAELYRREGSGRHVRGKSDVATDGTRTEHGRRTGEGRKDTDY